MLELLQNLLFANINPSPSLVGDVLKLPDFIKINIVSEFCQYAIFKLILDSL